MKQSRTVRFDMDNENDVKAFNILKSLKDGQGNQFIINAILNHDRQTTELSIDDIRQVLREELQAVSLVKKEEAVKAAEPKMTERAENAGKDNCRKENNSRETQESLSKAISFIGTL